MSWSCFLKLDLKQFIDVQQNQTAAACSQSQNGYNTLHLCHSSLQRVFSHVAQLSVSIWLMEPLGPIMMARKVQGDRLMDYGWMLLFESLSLGGQTEAEMFCGRPKPHSKWRSHLATDSAISFPPVSLKLFSFSFPNCCRALQKHLVCYWLPQ